LQRLAVLEDPRVVVDADELLAAGVHKGQYGRADRRYDQPDGEQKGAGAEEADDLPALLTPLGRAVEHHQQQAQHDRERADAYDHRLELGPLVRPRVVNDVLPHALPSLQIRAKGPGPPVWCGPEPRSSYLLLRCHYFGHELSMKSSVALVSLPLIQSVIPF